jgi:hypothetical protein
MFLIKFSSILSTPRIGIKANQVNIDNESCVSISLPSKGAQSLNNWINIYSQNLQKVVIKVPTILKLFEYLI